MNNQCKTNEPGNFQDRDKKAVNAGQPRDARVRRKEEGRFLPALPYPLALFFGDFRCE